MELRAFYVLVVISGLMKRPERVCNGRIGFSFFDNL